MKKKWGKVKPGDVVREGGRDWTVDKIKPKGRALRVKLSSGIHKAEVRVDPGDRVAIAEPAAKPRRAARPSDRKPTTPPAPAVGDPWETQQDRIEKMLSKTLGAVLVGEATDAEAGYYVPPVDVTTVAAHLALFHGTTAATRELNEDGLMEYHARAHLSAENGGQALAENHWHTKVRPTGKGAK